MLLRKEMTTQTISSSVQTISPSVQTISPSMLFWSSKVECPKCERMMSLRNLRYKHTCKAYRSVPEEKRQRVLEQSEVALESRLSLRDANQSHG